MNILILQSTQSGLYYHRQLVPHRTWLESGIDFTEDSVVIVPQHNLNALRDIVTKMNFDIVQYSVGIVLPPNFPDFFNYMKRRGAVFIIDVDDVYHGRTDVRKAIMACDALTTVSDTLVRYYSQYTDKIGYVIENGIDSQEPQFGLRTTLNEEPVFGYLGSTRHEKDLLSMNYPFHTRRLFTVCQEYQLVVNVAHHSFLKSWNDYAWEYDCIDVALAPLVDNHFNRGKSFLKVLESGFKKKAIITTDVEPYNRAVHSDIHPYFDRMPIGASWKDRIESFTLEEAKQRGEELYKAVQPYEVRQLNKKRREIYETILKKHRERLVIPSVSKTGNRRSRRSGTPQKFPKRSHRR